MRNSKQRGFTLIELLVVISVIALLVALLLPALQKAREAGYSAVCSSNLHQLYVAFSSYSADYNQQLPSTWPGGNTFFNALGGPYLGPGEVKAPQGVAQVHYRVLQCPAEKGHVLYDIPVTTIVYNMYDSPWAPTSYMVNLFLATWPGYTPTAPLFAERTSNAGVLGSWNPWQVSSVSQVSFLIDCGVWDNGWTPITYADDIDDNPAFMGEPRHVYSYGFRHPGGSADVLYMDGHAAPAQPWTTTNKYIMSWKYP